MGRFFRPINEKLKMLKKYYLLLTAAAAFLFAGCMSVDCIINESFPPVDEFRKFEKAAEIGTRKVIEEYSTVGVVVTTDGSFSEIERKIVALTLHCLVVDRYRDSQKYARLLGVKNEQVKKVFSKLSKDGFLVETSEMTYYMVEIVAPQYFFTAARQRSIFPASSTGIWLSYL